MISKTAFIGLGVELRRHNAEPPDRCWIGTPETAALPRQLLRSVIRLPAA